MCEFCCHTRQKTVSLLSPRREFPEKLEETRKRVSEEGREIADSKTDPFSRMIEAQVVAPHIEPEPTGVSAR